MNRHALSIVLVAAVFGTGLGVSAASVKRPVVAPVSAADAALVDKAAAYLQGLKSAQARFSQTDPRGMVTTGTFSLQRPGKARFAYDAPTDLTVVADGVNVNVLDGKLKTFDQYPLKQTPLSLLLGNEVRFDRAAVVTQVTREGAGFTITVRDAKRQAEGRLALNFSAAPMALSGWTVTDAQGMRTTVRLSGLKAGVALDGGLFVLRDPHPHAFRP